MPEPSSFILVFAAMLGAVFFWKKFFGKAIIHDHELALMYRNGTLLKELAPGKYRYYLPNTEIFREDARPRMSAAAGQEILTKERISLKVSLVMRWVLQDYPKARHASQNYTDELYFQFQMAIRQAFGEYELENVFNAKEAIVKKIMESVSPRAEEMGVEVKEIDIRDIMLPTSLKKAYSGIVEVRKNAEKDLEKTRGEQAVLRKLANFSQMLVEHPGLLQLRMVHAFAERENVTVHFGESLLNSTDQKKM